VRIWGVIHLADRDRLRPGDVGEARLECLGEVATEARESGRHIRIKYASDFADATVV